jgi:hypothetical protein
MDLVQVLEGLKSAPWVGPLARVALFLGILIIVYNLLKGTAFVGRLLRVLEETAFSNWRLLVLGTTAVVLSLVAGYTTFDGLSNFTGGQLLSVMATFGIQGVMLVTAWLIGESFATGMNQRSPRQMRAAAEGRDPGALTINGWQPLVASVIGVLLFISMFLLMLQMTGSVDVKNPGTFARSWTSFADKLLIAAVGILVVAVIALNAGSDLVEPYIQSVRVIIKNAIIWVMFLICMSVSVFFSFDSHFSGIFPPEERKRAAELRAQNQVAGILADIGSTIVTKRLNEAERMFDADGWKAYDGQLVELAKRSQGSAKEISAYFVQQMEAQRAAIAQQQERIATAQSGQAGLANRKISLTEELSRLRAGRPALAADYAGHKSELDAKAREIDAKRVEALAEEKGVEGTGKVGKGQFYRQRMAELARLQDEYKIKDERTRDAQKRLTAADTRIAQIERELSGIDGEIAKLKGETSTAEQRIKVAESSAKQDDGPRVDPDRVLPAFERSRVEFRQDPTVERLAELQRNCSLLLGAMAATPATRDKVRGLDCDPKQAAEAASVVFALNSGMATFEQECAGGNKLIQHTSADALFSFARKCLADSGLPSKETDQLRTKINFIELNRDDKAHRFVVTWNAFQDGNRLAYLALAIAITIDGMVFMAGLFGANAIRSPLSDVPTSRARSAQQLEAIIDTALLPHTFDNARTVLAAMRPMTQRDGYMARVIVHDDDPHAVDIRRVLNAGTTIGAVRHVDGEDRVYEVRAELFEYLSSVTKRAFDANREHAMLAELERTVTVALLPAEKVHTNAEMILGHLHPVHFPPTMLERFGGQKDHGFMAELKLSEVAAEHTRTVRNALNAGATLHRVQRVGDNPHHYYIHGDFYKTLVRIRARLLSTAGSRAIAGPEGRHPAPPLPPRSLTPETPAIAKDPDTKALAAPDRRSAGEPQQAAGRPASRPREPRRDELDAGAGDPAVAASLGEEEIERWRYRCWSDLVSPLKIDPSRASERLNRPGVAGLAAEAWAELTKLGEASETLFEHLREHKSTQEREIAAAYSDLRGVADGRDDLIDLLDGIDGDVQRNLPALMLFPENGLLADIIGRLEAAAAPDNGLRAVEQKLLGRLRTIRDYLEQSDLGEQHTWKWVNVQLKQLAGHDQSNIEPFAAKKGRIGRA